MPNQEDFDLDCRPETYFEFLSVDTMVRATVKGTLRRAAVRAAEEEEAPEIADHLCYEESIPDDVRDCLGSLHPVFMGGEYLPDLRRGEVEIARVTFRSTTGDVTSIRARWTPGRIRYRIVDEYPEKGPIECPIKSSTEPLTLRELILLADTAPHSYDSIKECLADNASCEGDVDNYRDFITVDSPYYPEITAWFEEVYEEVRREFYADCEED